MLKRREWRFPTPCFLGAVPSPQGRGGQHADGLGGPWVLVSLPFILRGVIGDRVSAVPAGIPAPPHPSSHLPQFIAHTQAVSVSSSQHSGVPIVPDTQGLGASGRGLGATLPSRAARGPCVLSWSWRHSGGRALAPSPAPL